MYEVQKDFELCGEAFVEGDAVSDAQFTVGQMKGLLYQELIKQVEAEQVEASEDDE